jgi:hypothetical protein
MAKSKLKTTLSVLREILGNEGNQDLFSRLIGKSASWVRHVSSGELPLTREAAYQIGFATGVNPEWLMSGNVESPPTSYDSAQTYTFATFQNYLEQKKSAFPELVDPLGEAGTKIIPEKLVKILSAIHDAANNHRLLHTLLNSLESFAYQISASSAPPIRDPEPVETNARKAAFARLVFRSGLLYLKGEKKESKSSSQDQ